MLTKSHAIDRLMRDCPHLRQRRFGLPYIGARLDGEHFNPTVQAIADAIDFYGYEVRDENIATIPDTDLGSGNPVKFAPFPPAVAAMKHSLDNDLMYRYPYTEGSDEIRKQLLEYVEKEGFVNTTPYSYDDIDEKGLSVHNITFSVSTSVLFNQIIDIISQPGDIVLVTGPNYGLFTIRTERAGAEVEILPLEREDNFLVNPVKLANRIDSLNESLQQVYHRRKGYVPRVVAFLNANPNNPTGKVMGKNEAALLQEISKVCMERGVFVIDDLVYRDISYDKENIAMPIATIPGAFRNTISLFGLSKSYSMAALRAGFVVADEVIIREIVNKTFQTMDSTPDIIGKALAGAFNATSERYEAYENYFTDLREIYLYKFNLLKALVCGIATVEVRFKTRIFETVINILGIADANKVLSCGLPMVSFPKGLEPEAGFFAILDFTELKGMKYKGKAIRTEKDLLQFFYATCRTRFLVGQSISWPYEDELVGRISYSIEDDKLVKSMLNIHNAILLLEPKDHYEIRKNRYEDQAQMARIKVDGWKNAYDSIISSTYLNSLNYEEQTKRYEASFSEYKDLVFVAVDGEEVLGYSCFNPTPNVDLFESELVSLYIKPNQIGKGIGTSLFLETCKELASLGKKNMIVWCLSDNEPAIKFYERLGGKIVKTKEAKIGDKYYKEYGFYFQLK
ncbi:MAG: aminotransferase class I/II-fold pyridoxal phosphate-dependent enzyme [Clostridia bacterium]|nr:aminotransferase class I/II-fold pyridoxal phosphate-dependent enzyme [Clostridia bacterium]